MKKKRKYKKDLEKAYDLYVKETAKYRMDNMSKDEFNRTVYKPSKVKKLTKGKKKDVNRAIAKKAIKIQFSTLDDYEVFVRKMRRVMKLGYTFSKEVMPRGKYLQMRMNGMKMADIIKETYKINTKHVKQLLMEAKQVGIKMSLNDLLSQGKGYQELVRHIEEHGWDTIDTWSYEEGTQRATIDDIDIEQ